MSRGITENDVWQAADALLLEGGRPTIERVRLKIGRGSPNTVSPHLDTWFKYLGGRIKDPRAFSAPPEVPDPVTQVAKHLWEVAQADARKDFDQRLQAAMAAAVSNVVAEKERATIAEAATFEAAARAARLQTELEARGAQLELERIARAMAETQLAEASQRTAEAAAQITNLERALSNARAEQKYEVELAVKRNAATERRAGLEIDIARQALAKAERRAEALERKLEAVANELGVTLTAMAEQAANFKVQIEQRKAEAVGAKSFLAVAQKELERVSGLLTAERLIAEGARSEAATARAIFEQLLRAKPEPSQPARVGKRKRLD